MRAADVLCAVGLALAAAVAACGGDSPRPASGGGPGRVQPAALVERLIAEDPQELLPRDDLFDAEPAFTWTFASQADLEPWETHSLWASRLRRRQWHLLASDDDPWLARRLDLDASGLHVVEVELRGLAAGSATLSWAGPEQPFAEARSITVTPENPRHPDYLNLIFDLTGHPLWRGRIERLRFDPTDTADDTVKLISIRGLRRTADPERLIEVLGRPWKIDLAADVRNALLAVPGIPVEREIEAGDGQSLRLSYGLEPAVDQAVEFRITATAGDADVLLQETLDPAAGDGDRWHEATLDLGAYAGRRLRLAFETGSPELLDLTRGFPVWGNPEVLGPRPDDGRPNVVLISIDTLRADRLSAYGHHRETSPHLDRWAESSAVLFENVVAQAPWTLPSHASMFTGLEALRHDVNHYQAAPASLEMLAETLRRAGYATAAVTGGGYLRPKFGFAQGFDVFRYWPQILAERELADGMEKTLAWLDENHGRRFFLLFHTYEVHFPHRRRQPYFKSFRRADRHDGVAMDAVRGGISIRARPQEPDNPLWQHDYFVVKLPSGEGVEPLNEAEKALVRTMYDSSIAYADAQLGRLFERLEALGLEGRTLIVVTSDHGEALGERDRAGHNYLEDYNVMVPLMIELPDGRGAGRRVERQVRSIDVAPTILDVLGISPPRVLDGVSLLPLIEGDAGAVPEEAWTYASSANYGLGLRYRNRLKYVFNNTAWSPYLGDEKLFDLRRDPAEEDDQARRDPATDELRSKVRRAIEAQHEGLRLRITNRGAGTLSGRLKHALAGYNRVKAADPACRCLSLGAGRDAAFSLAPGQEVTLFFESLPGSQVGFEGRLAVPGKRHAIFDETFDLTRIHQPVVFEHTGAGWRRSAPSGELTVGFTLWKQSERESLEVRRPVDDKLRDQLEALGYLNP